MKQSWRGPNNLGNYASLVWWVTGISASARWWEAVLDDWDPYCSWAVISLLQRPASQIITLIWGHVLCKPLLFLESKVTAGLGLGLETFRHLLEVWKRAL